MNKSRLYKLAQSKSQIPNYIDNINFTLSNQESDKLLSTTSSLSRLSIIQDNIVADPTIEPMTEDDKRDAPLVMKTIKSIIESNPLNEKNNNIKDEPPLPKPYGRFSLSHYDEIDAKKEEFSTLYSVDEKKGYRSTNKQKWIRSVPVDSSELNYSDKSLKDNEESFNILGNQNPYPKIKTSRKPKRRERSMFLSPEEEQRIIENGSCFQPKIHQMKMDSVENLIRPSNLDQYQVEDSKGVLDKRRVPTIRSSLDKNPNIRERKKWIPDTFLEPNELKQHGYVSVKEKPRMIHNTQISTVDEQIDQPLLLQSMNYHSDSYLSSLGERKHMTESLNHQGNYNIHDHSGSFLVNEIPLPFTSMRNHEIINPLKKHHGEIDFQDHPLVQNYLNNTSSFSHRLCKKPIQHNDNNINFNAPLIENSNSKIHHFIPFETEISRIQKDSINNKNFEGIEQDGNLYSTQSISFKGLKNRKSNISNEIDKERFDILNQEPKQQSNSSFKGLRNSKQSLSNEIEQLRFDMIHQEPKSNSSMVNTFNEKSHVMNKIQPNRLEQESIMNQQPLHLHKMAREKSFSSSIDSHQSLKNPVDSFHNSGSRLIPMSRINKEDNYMNNERIIGHTFDRHTFSTETVPFVSPIDAATKTKSNKIRAVKTMDENPTFDLSSTISDSNENKSFDNNHLKIRKKTGNKSSLPIEKDNKDDEELESIKKRLIEENQDNDIHEFVIPTSKQKMVTNNNINSSASTLTDNHYNQQEASLLEEKYSEILPLNN